MKKPIKIITLLVTGLLTIACSFSNAKPWIQGKSVQGNPLEIEISDKKIKEYESKMEQGKSLALEAKDFDSFLKIYQDLHGVVSLCNQAELTNELKYHVFAKEEDKQQYLAYAALGNKVSQWYNEVEHICADNEFKSLLFEGMSDEEIQEYIGIELPQEFYDAKNSIDQLTADYYALDRDENYYKNIDILYKQLLASENIVATYNGYDNFLEYSYTYYYGRDYSIEDTDSFFKNLYKYAAPAFQKYKNKTAISSPKLTKEEKDLLNTIFYGDAFTQCFEFIEDYKDFYGGFLQQEFDKLFSSTGHYNISYEEGGMSGAYQNNFYYKGNPFNYVFFGPGYHYSIAIVHEFGHYLAACANPSAYISFDFAETQSQSDEFMFLQYLKQSDNYDFSANFREFLTDYYVREDIANMFICATVNEAEKIVYAQDTYELGDLEKAVRSVYEEYPLLDTFYDLDSMIKYCTDVTMYSPGYYISYSTSILGALAVNTLASTNYDQAKALYDKIINPDGRFGYVEGYKYVGIGDPFSEETFKTIFA